jgi:RNA polymerase sigma-70 factor, ECF subfamily
VNARSEIGADVVARAQAGDESALAEVVNFAYPKVRRWALVRTGDPDEAEDLTQDVLVHLIRKLDSYRASARLTTWLYTLTRNAATDRTRRRSRRPESAPAHPDELAALAFSGDGPHRQAERAEVARALAAFFSELPARQREVFDLVELQGWSAAEAADALGIEPVSVRAHLFKARRAIRGRILVDRPELMEELP